MSVPRRLGAALALACLLTPPPAGAASGSYALDGQRRKSATYNGTLSAPVVPSRVPATDPTVPALDDCDPSRSCDVRELKLALPKRVTVGRFSAVVSLSSEVNAALVLYDSTKKMIYIDEVWRPRDGETVPACCPEGPGYVLEIFVERLRAGKYTLALVDRAGMGSFQAAIGWVAHPPDRR